MNMREERGTERSATPPVYEPPRVRLMSEEEVLSSFQVTLANAMTSTNWWVA